MYIMQLKREKFEIKHLKFYNQVMVWNQKVKWLI